MLDQYEEPVPNDLVVLSVAPKDLSDVSVNAIVDLVWYAPNRDYHPGFHNLVLVSEDALFDAVEDADCSALRETRYSLSDAGFTKLRGVDRIAHSLHRWGPDMFYHA